MASIGKIQEFNPVSERISMYLERVELFFTANRIAEEKQVPLFLSIIGRRNHTLLSDLLAPTKPAMKTFVQLKAMLMKHLEPNYKLVIIAERFQFHHRNWAIGETVAEY